MAFSYFWHFHSFLSIEVLKEYEAKTTHFDTSVALCDLISLSQERTHGAIFFFIPADVAPRPPQVNWI